MFRRRSYIGILSILLVLLAFISLFLGSELTNPSEFFHSIFFVESGAEHFILFHIRIPRVLTSIAAGMGLSVAGLMMQTYFRNSLAGPSILGISSGAGLGVAIVTMSASIFGIDFFLKGYTQALSSVLGSLAVLFIILYLSRKVGSGVLLLIIGILLSSFIGAVLTLLQYFTSPQEVQKYIIWTMGSTTSTSLSDSILLLVVIITALIYTFRIIAPLNALMLGERYAKSMGVNVKNTQTTIIILTGILTGVITAFCGPISFIGLAVPHLVRMKCSTANHNRILPYTILVGAIVMIIADAIAQMPFSELQLPINAVTSLIATPIVIITILKHRNIVD